MSTSKLIVCLYAVAFFVACKSPYYATDPENVISATTIPAVYPLPSSEPSLTIKVIAKFKATIVEKIVKRDAVTEFKLRNFYSRKTAEDVKIPMIGNHTEIFFFEVDAQEQLQSNERTIERKIKRGFMFAANFSPDSVCLGFGPLYAGSVEKVDDSTNVFSTTHFYKIKRSTDRMGEVKFCEKAKCPELEFFYNPSDSGIVFSQVVQKSKNKISGINKSLVYDIEPIFNDPDALHFRKINE